MATVENSGSVIIEGWTIVIGGERHDGEGFEANGHWVTKRGRMITCVKCNMSRQFVQRAAFAQCAYDRVARKEGTEVVCALHRGHCFMRRGEGHFRVKCGAQFLEWAGARRARDCTIGNGTASGSGLQRLSDLFAKSSAAGVRTGTSQYEEKDSGAAGSGTFPALSQTAGGPSGSSAVVVFGSSAGFCGSGQVAS